MFKDYVYAVGVDNKRGILYWAIYKQIEQISLYGGGNRKVILEGGKLNVTWVHIIHVPFQ